MFEYFWLIPLPGRGLDKERTQEAKEEREEQHLFLTAKVITDQTFSRHEGFDLVVLDEQNSSLTDLLTFRVPKKETYSTFKSRVTQRFNYSENQIRLWVLIGRQNKTVRPHACIPENEASLSMLRGPSELFLAVSRGGRGDP